MSFRTALWHVDGNELIAANRDQLDSEKELESWRVDWRQTVPLEQAKWFTGAFANQNVVCRLRDEETMDYLKREFGIDNI